MTSYPENPVDPVKKQLCNSLDMSSNPPTAGWIAASTVWNKNLSEKSDNVLLVQLDEVVSKSQEKGRKTNLTDTGTMENRSGRNPASWPSQLTPKISNKNPPPK